MNNMQLLGKTQSRFTKLDRQKYFEQLLIFKFLLTNSNSIFFVFKFEFAGLSFRRAEQTGVP